jgi:hypothetical protein
MKRSKLIKLAEQFCESGRVRKKHFESEWYPVTPEEIADFVKLILKKKRPLCTLQDGKDFCPYIDNENIDCHKGCRFRRK